MRISCLHLLTSALGSEFVRSLFMLHFLDFVFFSAHIFFSTNGTFFPSCLHNQARTEKEKLKDLRVKVIRVFFKALFTNSQEIVEVP